MWKFMMRRASHLMSMRCSQTNIETYEKCIILPAFALHLSACGHAQTGANRECENLSADG